VFGVPGFAEKRPDIKFDKIIFADVAKDGPLP